MANVVILAVLVGFAMMATGSAVVVAASWLEQLRVAIARALPQLTPQAQALALAHAAFESGFGAAFASRNANNPWNITAGSWWLSQGRAVLQQANADDVFDESGNKVGRIPQTWRRYDSLEAAARDYWEFLTTQNGGRYRAASESLVRADLPQFCERLRAAGYFTFPLTGYVAGVAAAMRRLNT